VSDATRPAPYVIGLTGNIAAGKSVVGQMLAGWGAQHIDADKIAHQAMARGQPAWERVVAEFGREILSDDGEIDRKKLGGIVFADDRALARLESLVHPAVRRRIEALIATAQTRVVVVEAIKLIESGTAAQLCDTLWVVTASRETQIRRLVSQRRLTRQEAERRIDAQPPQRLKVNQANVVIENDGTLEQLIDQVQEIWSHIDPKIAVQ